MKSPHFQFLLPPELMRNTFEYRVKYGKLINQCINYELRLGYNLSGYSEIESCSTNAAPENSDLWNLTFSAVVSILVMLCILSTVYDCILKPKDSMDHFQNRQLKNSEFISLK